MIKNHLTQAETYSADADVLLEAARGDTLVETVFRLRALAEIGAADTHVLVALAAAITGAQAKSRSGARGEGTEAA